LDSWGITGFSLFGIEASLDTLTRSIKTDTFAKEAPESVKATNTFNIGPKASLINPYFGTAIDAMTLDNRGTIDVRFEASSEGRQPGS